MPEAYTHIRIARGIVATTKIKPQCQNAYEMGANGPDPLFCGGIFPHKSKVNMQKLGSRIHAEKTGVFLCALLCGAKTAAQKSYSMGFLTHYAADSVMHPYVAAQTSEGGQFNRNGGHMFCESAMDSFFLTADKGEKCVVAKYTAPLLNAKELAEISLLLKMCIKYVFCEDLTITEIADAFNTFKLGHKVNVSRFGAKKLVAHAIDSILHINGALEGRMSPAAWPKDGFLNEWTNPFTNENTKAGPHALCMRAIELGGKYVTAANDMFEQKITHRDMLNILGNNSYNTGVTITNN